MNSAPFLKSVQSTTRVFAIATAKINATMQLCLSSKAPYHGEINSTCQKTRQNVPNIHSQFSCGSQTFSLLPVKFFPIFTLSVDFNFSLPYEKLKKCRPCAIWNFTCVGVKKNRNGIRCNFVSVGWRNLNFLSKIFTLEENVKIVAMRMNWEFLSC